MSVFQFVQSALDSRFLVGRQFVAVLFQVLLGLENHRVSLIDFVDTLFLLLVGFGVGLGFSFHTFDFVVRQTRRCLDADFLLLASGLVFGRNVQNAVGVDIESNLNLRHTARCWHNAVQVEAADGLVVLRHRAFALQHVNLNRRLVVDSCCEHFRFLCRDGGVGLDEFSHHAAHCLNTQRKRGNVEQQHVFHITSQDTALDGSTDGHNLVRVDTF